MIQSVSKNTGLACIVFAMLFFCPASYGATEDHYDISLAKDVPMVLLSAFSSVYGNYRLSQMEVDRDGMRDKSELLPWDRPIAGRYNEFSDKLSKWTGVLSISPIVLESVSYYRGESSGRDFAGFSLMFAEALALQNGLNLIVRSVGLWPRPYIYATSGKGLEKSLDAGGEAYGSFFSGHASAAFTVAVFSSEWFSSMHPNSPYRTLFSACAYSLASFVGVLRIAAGKHYPTDVALGALAGTGISYAVLGMHRRKNGNISLWCIGNSAGLAVRF